VHKIAVIGGDGTGREVTAEAVKVLDAAARVCDFRYETTDFDFGWRPLPIRTGEVLPESAVDDLRRFDAILLGAIGPSRREAGDPREGHPARVRASSSTSYINLRPVKLYPGVDTPLKDKKPEDIDFVVVRENTEGPVRRRGRHAEARHAGRGRGAGVDQHAQGRRALPPLRLRVHAEAESPEDAHALRQDERAHLRVRPLGARLPRDRPRATTPTSSATTRTSTRRACGW
jgi:isocitrate/isopropylmalate dehydrogenase